MAARSRIRTVRIWASDFFCLMSWSRKTDCCAIHSRQQCSNLLLDYAQATELKDGSRTVTETEHWLAVSTVLGGGPFETMLLPKHRVITRMEAMTDAERDDLALALKTHQPLR